MMKKITLLLAVLVYGFALNAQIVYFEDNFVGGDMTQWTTIDADGDGNEWAPATAASMNGDCLNSDSWTNALGGLNPDNYLVTAAPITFPTIADLSLKFRVGTFQINGTFIGDRYSVYLSTSNTEASILAGTELYNDTLGSVMTADQADGSASFFEHEFDLSAYQGQTLYLTFRHHSTFDMNSVLIGNVLVSSPFADDLVLNEVVSPATQANGCQLGLETVTASVTNNGANPITTFDATYVITNFLTGNLVDSVMETITVPSMALGDVTDFDFTTLTSDLSSTDSVYIVDVFVSMTGDQDLSSDTTIDFVASIANQTVPYFTSFELLNEAQTSIPEIDAWGWSTEDANGNGNVLEPTLLGAVNAALLVNGDCSLFYGDENEGVSDDWAFSPCIDLTMGSAYRISFEVLTNQFNTGDPVVEVIEVAYGMGANSGAMNVIRLDSLNDHTTFTTVTYDFMAPATGATNIGIHKLTQGTVSFLSIEEFSLDLLPAPTANITSSAIDPCTGLATLNFDVATGNEYIVDWGDGTIDTVTISPASHTYTATGTQNITLTANNLAGSNSVNGSVDNTLSAPVAGFNITQSGVTDASVGFTASNVQSCNTYTWDFGDGNTSTGPAANNTYVASGTFTVTLTVTNSAGTNTASQEVTVTLPVIDAINEINFVNGISIFPNPVNDVLNVSFELNSVQNIEIALVTLDGRIVNKTNTSNSSISTTINTSNLSSGIYLLNITSDNGIYTSAVMVK